MDKDKSHCLFICGYKRTGKDTLATCLNEGHTQSYLFYVRPGLRWSPDMYKGIPRRAFAEAVKNEVSSLLGRPFPDDSRKDEICPEYYPFTYRGLCIAVAERRKREVGSHYWAEQLHKNYNSPLIISDWRFKAEYDYMKTVSSLRTLRIYRSKVEVPKASEVTEHELDDVITDVLVVTSREDYTKACKLFPGYSTYELSEY